MDLSIVIPVFEGAGFVERSLPELARHLASLPLRHELILVDDGSTDDTAARIERLALPRARLLRLPRNCGKFAALAQGVAASRGACVLFTDADVPYDPRAIAYMAELVLEQGYDVVLGDRTLPESRGSVAASRTRQLASALFRTYVRIFVTGGLNDTQCGIKAFRGDVARCLFALLREPGFGGDVELIDLALRANLAVRRVPVSLVRQGSSSVRVLRHGCAMLLATWRIGWRRWRGDYRSDELAALARQGYLDGPPPGHDAVRPVPRRLDAPDPRRALGDGLVPRTRLPG